MNSRRRTRDAGLLSGRAQPPYVEIFTVFFVRRSREQNLEQPARVLLELASFGRGVSVAKDQKINLVGRIAALLKLDQRTWRCDLRSVNEHVLGINNR